MAEIANSALRESRIEIFFQQGQGIVAIRTVCSAICEQILKLPEILDTNPVDLFLSTFRQVLPDGQGHVSSSWPF